MATEADLRRVIGAKALRYGYIGVDRDNIVAICLEVIGQLERAEPSLNGPEGDG